MNAVAQLPSLALPPVGGLFAILGLYILLVGPINYLVLRRLGHREWAWATIPALIAIFAIGAYGFGASLRGSSVIVNEVALVRGAPGSTDGMAQVYVGVFSPTRGTYQLRFPSGALLSPPIIGDTFGGNPVGPTLDVLQGETSQVRDLAVGFGSLRTVRAETPIAVPLVRADLSLVDGRLKGTVTNASEQALETPTVVLGSTVARLPDLAAGETATVDVAVRTDAQSTGQSIADLIVGQPQYDANGQDLDTQRFARYAMINQLTYDPNTGIGQPAAHRRRGHPGLVQGRVAAGGDRRRESPTDRQHAVLPADASRDLRADDLHVRPAPIERGRQRCDVLQPTGRQHELREGHRHPRLSTGRPRGIVRRRTADDLGSGSATASNGEPVPVRPVDVIPVVCTDTVKDDCEEPVIDGLPETELFDLTTSKWVRLPHQTQGALVSVAEPARYIDPVSGTVMVRFVNEVNDQVGFNAGLSLRGTVK